MRIRLGVLLALGLVLGCGDDDGGGGGGDFPAIDCGEVTDTAGCVEISTAEQLLDEVNLLTGDTTLVLAAGRFDLTNAVTIRADGVHLVGQGIDTTTLAFSAATTQFNGVDVVGDGFLVQDLTVLDAPKDGIRVEESDGVTFRRIRATWTNEGDSENGAYGIYPVKSRNVLVEDCKFTAGKSDTPNAGVMDGLPESHIQNVTLRNVDLNGGKAKWQTCQYVDNGVCEGSTNACPPCFKDRTN